MPRVSENSKRPDHISVVFGLLSKPLIVTIESKETATDLESNIGPALKKYISDLLKYSPSVERNIDEDEGRWKISDSFVDFADFECVSVGCFLISDNCTFPGIHEFKKYTLPGTRELMSLRDGAGLRPIKYDLSVISEKCKCDVLIGFCIDEVNMRYKMKVESFSPLGSILVYWLKRCIMVNNKPVNIFEII